MYYYYDNYGPDYYKPPEQYSESEPVYYELESVYYAPQPVSEDNTLHDDQDYDGMWEADMHKDFDDRFAADIPSYNKKITEGFSEEGEVAVDLEEQDQWDGDQYVLRNSLEYGAEEGPTRDGWSGLGECFVQAPPEDESPEVWYDVMDAWHACIVANHDVEVSGYSEEDVDMQSPPVHASWVTAKLAELQYALRQEEIGPEQYVQEHADWLADELEDQRLQATGYVWDEERADYRHPVGYRPTPPPSDSLETPDIEQFSPLPYIVPELYEPANLEPDTYEPSRMAQAPPTQVEAHPFAFTVPLHSVHRKPVPIRYNMPRTVYTPPRLQELVSKAGIEKSTLHQTPHMLMP
ncbi:hypothetical protein K438DRAFT_1960065 [Mycena galopus ATCC 62051]|nr:hypothetical protein K438DRAFT_1960065 [Mycena galopus ATCC 62051]